MEKATKETLAKLAELEAEYNRLTSKEEMTVDEQSAASQISEEYISLVDQYDFDHDVFVDEAGHKGVKTCWGDIWIPAKYDAITFDSNGFIFMTLDGKEGFIANSHIVEPKFDGIEIDDDEYLAVTQNGQKGYIDENDDFTPDRREAYYNMQMFV